MGRLRVQMPPGAPDEYFMYRCDLCHGSAGSHARDCILAPPEYGSDAMASFAAVPMAEGPTLANDALQGFAERSVLTIAAAPIREKSQTEQWMHAALSSIGEEPPASSLAETAQPVTGEPEPVETPAPPEQRTDARLLTSEIIPVKRRRLFRR